MLGITLIWMKLSSPIARRETPLVSVNGAAGIRPPAPKNNTSGRNIMIRIEWAEIRSGEAYRVIAEKQPAEHWEFWEKACMK